MQLHAFLNVYTKSRNVWEMVRARGRNLLCSKIHWLQSDSAGEHDVYFFYFYPIASNIFFPRGPVDDAMHDGLTPHTG